MPFVVSILTKSYRIILLTLILLVKQLLTTVSKLWVMHSSSYPTPNILSFSSQQVTITMVLDSNPCVLSMIYTSTYYVKRRDLWQELKTLHSTIQDVWLVVGDFNTWYP